MFEPHLKDPDPQCNKIYPQKVFCLQHHRQAQVVVATWPHSEEGWSDWRVIDCSILPPGAIHCGMDCLSQAKVQLESQLHRQRGANLFRGAVRTPSSVRPVPMSQAF